MSNPVEIQRIIRELRVIEPELRPGERIVWEAKANRYQSKLRAVGGRLYLTDRRLVFARHEFDASIGGEEWSAPLTEIEGVDVAGLRRLVHVHLGGETERFVVWPSEDSADLIRGAAEAAREPRGPENPLGG